MEDWEDEQIPDLLKKDQPRSKWDDEDVDDNDIKESWEDEDETTPAPKPEPPVEKASKKPAAKSREEKGKEVVVDREEVPLDPVAEKLRQQSVVKRRCSMKQCKARGGVITSWMKQCTSKKCALQTMTLVEEADYRSTAELFAKKGGDDKTLDSFIPKSESDFLEYAELISHKLRPYEKSYHYIGLLKDVMRLSMTALNGQDANEVSKSVNAISNEKIKEEKEANTSKKKTGAKKKQLQVDRADDDAVINAYDGYDDYDFM